VGVLFIKRDKRGAILMMATSAAAILEAFLWAWTPVATSYENPVPVIGPTYLPWIAARGTTAVVFVMTTWVLARAVTLRWGRKTQSGGEAQARVAG